MDNTYVVIAIVIIALVTFLTRSLPFIAFGKRPLPSWVTYLGKVLPPAIMVVLVCYCLKGITFSTLHGFLPEIIACLITAGVHVYKKNMYLSIIIGTICYMVLIKLI
ncbi:MAG: AzlD domain-containing protein [Saccharofermentans sp.]|nr:AzlD domain-containing protein [Saccharofermentans sp.]